MNWLPRLVLCALTALLLFCGFNFVRSRWFGSSEASIWNVLEYGFQIAQEERRADELSQQSGAVQQCTMRKEEVLNKLLDGRLTLVEAAQSFGRLNEETYGRCDPYPEIQAAPSVEEGLCLNVLTWVRTELHDQPERAAAALAHYEAEFHDLFPGRPTRSPLQGALDEPASAGLTLPHRPTGAAGERRGLGAPSVR
jgi:hypothetical protein